MHITMSFADGSPARISSINTALRHFRPSFIHIWELKTFWHERIICEDDVEVRRAGYRARRERLCYAFFFVVVHGGAVGTATPRPSCRGQQCRVNSSWASVRMGWVAYTFSLFSG